MYREIQCQHFSLANALSLLTSQRACGWLLALWGVVNLLLVLSISFHCYVLTCFCLLAVCFFLRLWISWKLAVCPWMNWNFFHVDSANNSRYQFTDMTTLLKCSVQLLSCKETSASAMNCLTDTESISFQLQDTETTSGESEVKFQVSRDTLAAMLRSMAYIREQLSNTVSSLGHFSKYHLFYPSNFLKNF